MILSLQKRENMKKIIINIAMLGSINAMYSGYYAGMPVNISVNNPIPSYNSQSIDFQLRVPTPSFNTPAISPILAVPQDPLLFSQLTNPTPSFNSAAIPSTFAMTQDPLFFSKLRQTESQISQILQQERRRDTTSMFSAVDASNVMTSRQFSNPEQDFRFDKYMKPQDYGRKGFSQKQKDTLKKGAIGLGLLYGLGSLFSSIFSDSSSNSSENAEFIRAQNNAQRYNAERNERADRFRNFDPQIVLQDRLEERLFEDLQNSRYELIIEASLFFEYNMALFRLELESNRIRHNIEQEAEIDYSHLEISHLRETRTRR